MPTAVDILFDSSAIDVVKSKIMELIPVFDRVARATTNGMRTAARDQVKAETDASKLIGREADRAAKEKERAARSAAKEQERIASAAQKAELNFIKAGQMAIAAAEKERTRAAEEESRKRIRLEEHEASARAARNRAFGRSVATAGGRVMGMAGRIAGVATALGGGFTLADALGAGIRNEATAGQIVRSAQEKGGITSEALQSKARTVAIKTGGKTEDVLHGVDAFVQKTGDLKAGVNLLDELGLEAASSGAKIEDLGSTAAEVFAQLGDTGKTTDVMRALIGQGKAGAVDIRNLSQYGGRLTSTAALFEGDPAENIKSFGSLAQVAKLKGGATDAAEATEAAARLFDEIATHKEDFEAAGVKVKGAGGKLRGVQDILLDTLVKNKGDITTIPHLLGRQAGKVEIGLANAFLEGSGGGKDAASLQRGRQHASELIETFQRPVSQGELDADLKSRLAENDAKLNQATEALHVAINEKLLPKLPELIDAFSKLIPVIAKLVDTFASFPMATIATGMVTAFGVELGKAELAKLVASKIGGLFAGKGAEVVASAVGGKVATGVGGAEVGALLGGGAEVGGALTVGGAVGGNLAVGLALGTALRADVKRRMGTGDKMVQDVLAEPEETTDQRQAKMAHITSTIATIKEGTSETRAMGGGDPTMGGRGAAVPKLNFEAEGAAASIAKLSATLDRLDGALSKVADTAYKMPEMPSGWTGSEKY